MNRATQHTSLGQRLEILQRAQDGADDPTIARTMALSPWTVRKWRRLGRPSAQRSALAPRMGRPPTGALGHFALSLREEIRHLRTANPGWGAKTLRLEIEKRMLPGKAPPSCSRIAAFLKVEGLTRPYHRRSPLPQPNRSVTAAPHGLWQMDAQGAVHLPTLGRVALINIVDSVSRVKTVSWPCLNTTTPATADYQLALRSAFLPFGLPQRVSVDHDGVFYDTTCSSPYPSLLHLWLIALGVEVIFTRRHRPTDHACVERMHQTVMHQALDGQDPATAEDLYAHLSERLAFLNEVYPSRSLEGQPPLVACPQAQHAGRLYRPEWEAEMIDLERVYAYLAGGRWFRHVCSSGRFWLGNYSYGVGKQWAKSTIEITFRPETHELLCTSADGKTSISLPVKGLTKLALMGEMSPSIGLQPYQPMLPLDAAAWRQAALGTFVTGTTL